MCVVSQAMAHWQCVRVYARQAMCILPHPQIRGNMPAKLYAHSLPHSPPHPLTPSLTHPLTSLSPLQIRGNMPAKLYGYLDPTRWMQGAADPTPMTVSSVWGDDVGNL